MHKYQYPCTKHIEMIGFGEFLEKESRVSRSNINQLAKELCSAFGPEYITLVNSGTSANLVAALALAEKIKKDGKPLTAVISAFTFPTTIDSLLMAGFSLQMVDVEKNGFNMSVPELAALPIPPSLICVTHFLGFPCDMPGVREYADKNHCYIMQDACETMNPEIDGRYIFEYGDITTWSFYHPHHLSAYGGGAVITANREDYLLCDSIAHWGRGCKCHVDESLCHVPDGPAHQFTYERLGVNVEMSELNACFGRWQMRDWIEQEKKRNEHYDKLYEAFSVNPNVSVWKKPDTGISPFVFPIMLKNGMSVSDLYVRTRPEDFEIRTLMGGVSNRQQAFRTILPQSPMPNADEMEDKCFIVGIHQTLDHLFCEIAPEVFEMQSNYSALG